MSKVLIVVDMQNGFMREYNKHLIEKINNLVSSNKYEEIIFTQFKNKEESMYVKRLNWSGLMDEDSQNFCVNVPEEAIVFEKYTYGLTDKQLQYLKSLNVEEIDICGVQTDACVYAISFQLFDMGIFPNVLINYVATNPDREDVAEDMLIHQFGKVCQFKF